MTLSGLSNNFKNNSPQRHRGHREKHIIVKRAGGAVNNINLCASVVKNVLTVIHGYNQPLKIKIL
ncbi:MAG: hypothetical protein COA54_00105 [Thiotrichaceae bacterium]|nr:MAG: hypothetical protein COA54_00105 [Thiotrichaceae bacterium]